MAKIENKKQFLPSKLIVILVIIILIVAFLGAFAFSFIKSPPSSLLSPTLNQSNPGGLPSTGGVGNLPSGTTVKTEEEGIAVCKKSGVDYCWSAVAVSFNDLSVCKMAQDVKQCESDAKDLMQLHSQSQ